MRKRLKPFTFHIEVAILGSTRERAWKNLIKTMEGAGFIPKPKDVDSITKSLIKKGK